MGLTVSILTMLLKAVMLPLVVAGTLTCARYVCGMYDVCACMCLHVYV